MLTEHGVVELRKRLQRWRELHQRIAFIPTMGNLHAGHIALVKRARELAQRVVVSIFVNPLQFGPDEDYTSYPRTLDADKLQLAVAGADMAFVPDLATMYPQGPEQTTRVSVPEISTILDGEYRPGHFDGVATAVCKLFHMVQPDIALFGEKDYQQLMVVRRLVRDLCLPVEITGVPTVREPNRLAMSSRNQYLTRAELGTAPLLYHTLLETADAIRDGTGDLPTLEREASRRLSEAGFRPDYVAIREAGSLALPAEDAQRFVVLGAAWLGKARLIDNVQVDIQQDDRTVNLRGYRPTG
ncbi:MAG TPA: pantoate--beta-alanine ligase [Gammaproteobacteria bacterium]|nr:pantoate--beta-alanine ligase [Gammaproteobacteria bacterium]